ncbi:MAG: hypothetical protein KME31_07270 [Tolypothrix carrinoi HA7290-LM1]|nr:hypothetical protein [Tolypothrix carrinoi HA7290-LM1]
MGNGQWAMGNGQWAMGNEHCELVRREILFMPHAPCLMTADATTFVTSRAGSPLRIDGTGNRARGLTATHCLPHAPCPMPNSPLSSAIAQS